MVNDIGWSCPQTLWQNLGLMQRGCRIARGIELKTDNAVRLIEQLAIVFVPGETALGKQQRAQRQECKYPALCDA